MSGCFTPSATGLEVKSWVPGSVVAERGIKDDQQFANVGKES
jgi:hypothetical protein